LDQASAAEAYRLNLVAGMGYRKALEFLAKDYAVYDLRLELDEAKEAGDQARMDKISAQIDEITGKWLSEILQMIPDPLTKEAAKRAAWLGNDETHYTRVWTKHDVDDLKRLLGIVANYEGAERPRSGSVFIGHLNSCSVMRRPSRMLPSLSSSHAWMRVASRT